MRHQYPIKFMVKTELAKDGPCVVFRIEEGYLVDEYEIDPEDAIETATQLIRAAHAVRRTH